MRLNPESWFVWRASLRHWASGRNGGTYKVALASDTAMCAPGPGVEALRLHSLPFGWGLHPPLKLLDSEKAETQANVDKESTLLFTCFTCMGCLPVIKSTSRAMWHTQWKMGFTVRFHVSLQWDVSHFCWVTENQIDTSLKLKVIYLTQCKTRALQQNINFTSFRRIDLSLVMGTVQGVLY